jgi:hypothetical protein
MVSACGSVVIKQLFLNVRDDVGLFSCDEVQRFAAATQFRHSHLMVEEATV